MDGGGTIRPMVQLKFGETWSMRLVPGVSLKARTEAAETHAGVLLVTVNEA